MHEALGFGETALYVMIPIYTLSIWFMAFVSSRLTWSGYGSGYRNVRRSSWEVEDGLGRRTREAPPLDDVVRSSRHDHREHCDRYCNWGRRYEAGEEDLDRRDMTFPLRIERESRTTESPSTSRKPRAPLHAPIIGQSDRYNR